MIVTLKNSIWGFLLLLTLSTNASALTIIGTFTGGTAPANTAGGGNLVEIFAAAARTWERAIQDEFTLRLYFGWAHINSAGNHALMEQSGNPIRETVGVIMFNNDVTVPWYLDPTPLRNEEYRRVTEDAEDLGGGFINVARIHRNPMGEAAGRCDLYSVALHEIGHALGLSLANPSFVSQSADGTIHIGEQFSYAGTVVPLSRNLAGIVPHFDPEKIAYGSVMAGVCGDERRIPSALDILAVAQVSAFQSVNPSLQEIPASLSSNTSGITRKLP